MRIIGLTGGIATGKDTVAHYLADKGMPVFDADAEARAAVAVGTPGLAAVVRAFGKQYLLSDGSLDRRALGRLVFERPELLRQLERIVHSYVEERLQEFLRRETAQPVLVLNVPLLLECGWQRFCTEVWVVTVSKEQQVARAAARSGLTSDEVLARINRQMTFVDKSEWATVVLDNAGSLTELYGQVELALGMTCSGGAESAEKS